MLKLALLTTTALFVAAPAFAGGEYNPPPKPTPPTQVQGQAQGQAQGQRQTAKGGAGGAGGSVTNNITTGPGGAATPAAAAAAPSVNVQNNNGGATSGTGNSGWNGNQFPVASATAPSFAIGMCQWAVSGGAQFFGFGASGGGAGLYEFCKPMMKADHFRKQGNEAVAKNLECNYDEFRAAYRDAGQPCRQDLTKEQLAAERTASAAPAQRAGYIGPNGFVPYPAGYRPQ